MANNYLVTLASEMLYKAAKKFLDSYPLPEGDGGPGDAPSYEYDDLAEAVDQYRNLAYQVDRVIETKPLKMPTETP